jgi:hypothetical protein
MHHRSIRIHTVLLLAIALLFAALPAAGLPPRDDDADRKSKNGKTEGTIDGVGITIEYGRPSARGRDIWGDLVKYDKVWRTGADEATTITFSEAVKVEGQDLAAGTYGLFTIPGEGEWVIIFNKVAEQWGAYDYNKGEDALRVTVTPEATEHVESMDFVIGESAVSLRWDKLAGPCQVAAGG